MWVVINNIFNFYPYLMSKVKALDYKYMEETYSKEVLNLASVNKRFDVEFEQVRIIRDNYCKLFMHLTVARDNVWRSEAWRNYNIAITELENSCIRAVKWFYS